MGATSTSVTAGEVMDRSAVLLNDPAKTDYTYIVLSPYLGMAIDELGQNLIDNQSAPMINSWNKIIVPKGHGIVYPFGTTIPNAPTYPVNLIEIQEIHERPVELPESNGGPPFVLMRRVEFVPYHPPQSTLREWCWESNTIKFNTWGATTDREILLAYIGEFINIDDLTPDAIIGGVNARAYLSFKTAALASMFIGENPERAAVLEDQAQGALERIISISNKGRQQIMTRHRPFRAAFKARGGF